MTKKLKKSKKGEYSITATQEENLAELFRMLKVNIGVDYLYEHQKLPYDDELVSILEAQQMINDQIQAIVPDAENMRVAVSQDGTMHFSMRIQPAKPLKYITAEIILTPDEMDGLTHEQITDRFVQLIKEMEEDD